MKLIATALAGIFLLGMIQAPDAVAQSLGDYRSATTGDWSAASTWEVFVGTWVPADNPPNGSENITITAGHTVSVDIGLSVTGHVRVEAAGQLTVGEGSLTFAAGSTYEHARDGGSVPIAEWGEGSTFLLTGTEQDAPGNRNQDFHHVTINTPDLARNRDLGWNDITIGGDVRVISTGANRWQLTSAPATESRSFSILGDVIVENGEFAVQGTGNAFTDFEVHHYGDVIVTGGNFSLARGSQGSGTGTTTWFLYEGDFSMADARTQNSNPEPGQAKVVFAADGTQQLAFDNVNAAGFHFEVTETTTLEIADGFEASGLVVNRGAIDPLGDLTFGSNSTYEHARNGGDVPSAVWAEGSTALFTGITTDAPGNRGQDYHHLVLNTPDLVSNRDLSLHGNTISGDIHVISTGSARWQLVGGSSGVVTILGDVIVESGQFATQGTGSPTEVIVDHYGDIIVTGGNFSVSRGSQGGEQGEGSTRWYLHEGDLSLSDATTQNSNPWRATFVFARDGEQVLELDNVTYAGGGLPITVADGATLHIAADPVRGNGAFTVEAGGALAVPHAGGVAEAVQTTGEVSFDSAASFIFDGTEAQVTSELMPVVVEDLVINNEAGVALTQETTINGVLRLQAGVFDNTVPFQLGPTGSISFEGGSLAVGVSSEETAGAPAEFRVHQNYPNPFSSNTTFHYEVGENVHVSIVVYDVTGRKVGVVVDELHAPGTYGFAWDATGLASGVYLYRITAGEYSEVRRLTLMN